MYVFVAMMCCAGVLTLARPGELDAFLEPDGWFRGEAADWLRCTPIVGFSYLCHQNVPTFYAEMGGADASAAAVAAASRSPSFRMSVAERKPRRFAEATRAAMLVAVVLYAATAWGGYAAFGAQSKPNVLLNFVPGPHQPLPDATVVGLRAAFVGTMIFTFPTLSLGLRTSLHTLAFPERAETPLFRWAEAAALVLAVGASASAVEDLGLVFQLVGSTCGSLLMFILPASLRLFGATTEHDAARMHAASARTWLANAAELVLAWLAMLFGAVVLVGSNAMRFFM